MKSYRKAKSCEWSLESGSVVCFYQSLAHLRLQTAVNNVRRKLTNTGTYSAAQNWNTRWHVQCQVCRRAETLSYGGLTMFGLLSLLRSLDRRHTDATFITWRMELQPTGQEKSSVSSVFGPDTVMAGTTQAEMRTLFGSVISGTSSMVVSHDPDGLQTTF